MSPDREWFPSAACVGQDALMHDAALVDVALDLCRGCEVIVACTDYYDDLGFRPTFGVAHGHDYWRVRGRPRIVQVRRISCVSCGVVVVTEPGSTVDTCLQCRSLLSAVLGDVSEVGRIARSFLDEG